MPRPIAVLCRTLAPCAAALALWSTPARAQVPTVMPDGTLSDPAAPPPSPPSAEAPPPAAGGTGGTAAADDEGYYITEDYGEPSDSVDVEGRVISHGGPVPPVHVVRRGDTLWDICWLYFGNPWEWPKVWSYNPEITNPHWIYPGDQVRLVVGGSAAPLPPTNTGSAMEARRLNEPTDVELRQLAFVDKDELDLAIKVVGSIDEKRLLASGDEVYLEYAKGHPPKVGSRLSIYQEREVVRHPKDKDRVVGAYVRIVGDLEVVAVKQDKHARAVILDAVDAVERGMKVGPLQRQFKHVDTVKAKVNLEGTIVAQLGKLELIGARQVVFIDLGTKQGVTNGNRLFVIRRGDAYEKVMGPRSNVGKDDARFPAHALGEILVVQAGQTTSVAIVALSMQEFGVGDRVLLRKAE